MKKRFRVLGFVVLAAILGLAVSACDVSNGNLPENGNVNSPGIINGKAYFTNGDNHAGITITLEKTDGLRSAAVLSAAHNIASGARNIDAARSVLTSTQTVSDGSYSFSNIAPGTYTIYASSPNSCEKAVAVNNVTVEAGRSVTAADLNLTAVGSIIGRILLDNNTDTGNFGFLVSVAGTSYMAMSGDNGRFTISNVPAGSGYLVVIMKGSFTAVWSSDTISVTGGQTTALEPNPRIFTTVEIGGIGIIWKGEYSTAPSNPQLNWAYYNTVNKTSYIWNGSKWDVLAAQGLQGENGSDGNTPYIGNNGNWWIGNGDTGVKAQGPQGENGSDGNTPYVGSNGNWWIGNSDTGVKSRWNHDVIVISAGFSHTMAIRTDGSLWAWRSNSSVRIGSDTWSTVSAGYNHTVAIKTDGSLWAWGQNFSGQLGDGTTTYKGSPVRIGSETNWSTVSAGESHTVAIKTDGSLWAWGADMPDAGIHNNVNAYSSPVRIGSETNWSTVSAGYYHTVAIKTDGSLWTWGLSPFGGDGTYSYESSPVRIGSDNNWAAISAGYAAMAIRKDGSLWAWGSNYYGQLGDDSLEYSHSPVRILP